MNLLDYRSNKYTTIGNDGIIDFVFKRLNLKYGFFVEFGAWDGIKSSNCRKLYDEGWSGVFIEADNDKYKELKKNYKNNSNINCCNNKIGLKNDLLFDRVIEPYIGDNIIDFCSIDIDGLDLEVFETFDKYLPIVICIEGGQMLEPDHKRIKKSVAKHNIQQSLNVMVKSFEKKGYKLLCSYQDSFFIKNKYYSQFDVSSDITELYFNGLVASYHRLPFIQKYTKKVGLRNYIVDYVLKKSNYSKYKWDKRKKWVTKEKELILSIIEIKKQKELNRENKKYEYC